MGRLAGFRYREVVRRLRSFGFQFDRPGPAAMKCGVIRKPEKRSLSRITQAIWQREHFERFSARLESKSPRF
jgi:hypothetical protein